MHRFILSFAVVMMSAEVGFARPQEGDGTASTEQSPETSNTEGAEADAEDAAGTQAAPDASSSPAAEAPDEGSPKTDSQAPKAAVPEAPVQSAQDEDAPSQAMRLAEAQKIIAAFEAEQAAAKAAAEKKRKQGLWSEKRLSVGATALGLFNSGFIGQADGLGLQMGLIASGAFTLGYQGHLWTSSFDVAESLVATPNADNYLAPILSKAADRLQAQTEYRFQWQQFSYVGPFARAQMQAVVFPSWVQRPQTTRVVKNNIDRDPSSYVIGANLPIATTGYFEPLIFNETAGVLIEPPPFQKWVTSLFRVSAAAQHQLAWGGHILADNPDTPELELNQVAIVNSAGVQAEAEFGGQVIEQVAYSLKAAVFYPVLALGDGVENVSLVERVHMDVEAKTSLRLAEWLSLDGVVLVRRQPFVINAWQLQTSLLLTSSYSIF